jgi:hypothetical protein
LQLQRTKEETKEVELKNVKLEDELKSLGEEFDELLSKVTISKAYNHNLTNGHWSRFLTAGVILLFSFGQKQCLLSEHAILDARYKE